MVQQEEARWVLTPAEEAAAKSFIEALQQRLPDVAKGAEYGRGHEGTVYVYCRLPQDEDQELEVHEIASQISGDVLVESGVMVLLMEAGPDDDLKA